MDIGKDMVGDEVNFVPTRPASEILEEVAGVWSYLYEPERFLKRAARVLSANETHSSRPGDEKPGIRSVCATCKGAPQKETTDGHALPCS